MPQIPEHINYMCLIHRSQSADGYVTMEACPTPINSISLSAMQSAFASTKLSFAPVSSGPHPSDYVHALSAYHFLPAVCSASGAPCRPGQFVGHDTSNSFRTSLFFFVFKVLKG